MSKVLAGMAILALAGHVQAAGQKPERTQGLEGTLTAVEEIPLAAQNPAMAGYALRGRRITVLPGGAITEHSHADRPGIAYILEGTVTEYRGAVARVVKAGDTWVEDAGTVHWFENVSDKPCVIWVADLVVKK